MTDITDLPTADYATLVDEIAHAIAEADGIRYWKFDDGPSRKNHETQYRILARRHLAAHRVLFNRALRGWPTAVRP